MTFDRFDPKGAGRVAKGGLDAKGPGTGAIVRAIVWKDVRLEGRTGELWLTPSLLALLLMLVFIFALPPGVLQMDGIFTASLWVTLFFAGTVGVVRSFGRERDEGRLWGLLLAPADRSAVFLAKALVSFVFLALVAAVTMPLFFATFGVALAGPLWRWLVVAGLVLAAYSSAGSLIGALAAQLRGGDVLFPVLLFPLLVPVVLSAVHLSDALLVRGTWADQTGWLHMLYMYNALFWVVPYLLFEYVVEV